MSAKKQILIASSGSLSQQAYNMIRASILKAELPLGAALSRRKLAEQLGMSFLPVSEALQRLEGEGLVESRPRVGTRVRVPTSQDIRGHYVVREALYAAHTKKWILTLTEHRACHCSSRTRTSQES